MRARTILLLLLALTACGKRPAVAPLPSESLVITGVVVKVEVAADMKVEGGVVAMHTATVKVSKVASGKGVKPGDTIRAQWLQTAAPPTRPLPGVQTFDYGIKEGDEATFRLEGLGTPYAVVRSKNGIEKVR